MSRSSSKSRRWGARRRPRGTERALCCDYPPQIFSRQLQAHGLAVDNLPEANPLRTVLLVAQIESAVFRCFKRNHSIHHQFAFANQDVCAADPRAFIAIVSNVAVPFLGIRKLFR